MEKLVLQTSEEKEIDRLYRKHTRRARKINEKETGYYAFRKSVEQSMFQKGLERWEWEEKRRKEEILRTDILEKGYKKEFLFAKEELLEKIKQKVTDNTAKKYLEKILECRTAILQDLITIEEIEQSVDEELGEFYF